MELDRNDPVVKRRLEYLASKRALIFLNSSSERVTIRRMLGENGISKNNIQLADCWSTAKEMIASTRPHFVLSMYRQENEVYTDLLIEHGQCGLGSAERGFWFFSDTDNSLSLVGELSEHEIEGFIIRPFTFDKLQSEFLSIVDRKAAMKGDALLLDKAQLHLRNKEHEQAIEIFQKVKRLPQYPVKADYLLGMTHKNMGDLPAAEKIWCELLQREPLHYQTLNELFMLHIEQKNYKKAMIYANTLVENYPIVAKRIPDLTRIAVATARFKSILHYYEIYKKLENVGEETVRNHLAAGLGMAGKYIGKEGDESRPLAIDALKKAAEMAQQKSSILAYVVECLYQMEEPALAESILEKVKEDTGGGENVDYKLIDLEIREKNMPAKQAFLVAEDLYGHGKRSPIVFRVLIGRAVELGRPADQIEHYLQEAQETFPNLAGEFTAVRDFAITRKQRGLY